MLFQIVWLFLITISFHIEQPTHAHLQLSFNQRDVEYLMKWRDGCFQRSTCFRQPFNFKLDISPMNPIGEQLLSVAIQNRHGRLLFEQYFLSTPARVTTFIYKQMLSWYNKKRNSSPLSGMVKTVNQNNRFALRNQVRYVRKVRWQFNLTWKIIIVEPLLRICFQFFL